MKCGYCKTVGHKIGACNAGEHLLEVNLSNYESLTARELKWLVAHKKGKTYGKNKSDLLKMLKESECPICMESSFATEKTVCGHSFCKSCLSTHLENNHTCPLCRTSLKNSPGMVSLGLIDDDEDDYAYDDYTDEMIRLTEARENRPPSELEAAFYGIKNILNHINIPKDMENKTQIIQQLINYILLNPLMMNDTTVIKIMREMAIAQMLHNFIENTPGRSYSQLEFNSPERRYELVTELLNRLEELKLIDAEENDNTVEPLYIATVESMYIHNLENYRFTLTNRVNPHLNIITILTM